MLDLSRFLKPKFLLVLICTLLLFTRIYKISQIPPSVYWDEASIGYNAYSISQTGKDEWGDFLPIHFRAFGEFKLPVYIYSVVPFVKIFGLNEWAIRLPAVLFSLATVILIYVIALKLTNRKDAALYTAFFMTISPWFFIFSRVGYEISAGLTFYLLAIYLFLYAFRKKYLIIFTILSLILSIYSYNSFRIVSSITFIIFIIILLRKENFKSSILVILVSTLLFLFSMIPIIRLFVYDAGFGRVQAFTLFPSIQQVYDLSGKPHFQIIFDRSKSPDWGKNISLIFENFLSHFSPSFLLFEGDPNPRSQQPGFGQIYIPDIVLIVFGILYITSLKNNWKYKILLLLLLGILPASLFKESPHALRSLTAVPFLILLISCGAVYLSSKYSKSRYLIIALYLGLFTIYFQHFAGDYSKNNSQDWQYGYKALINEYKDKFKDYNSIVISDNYGQPYIFALYYLRYDPNLYLSSVQYNPVQDWGFSKVEKFGKFEFQKERNLKISNVGKTLLFTTIKHDNFSQDLKSSVKFLDDKVAFWVYEL